MLIQEFENYWTEGTFSSINISIFKILIVLRFIISFDLLLYACIIEVYNSRNFKNVKSYVVNKKNQIFL